MSLDAPPPPPDPAYLHPDDPARACLNTGEDHLRWKAANDYAWDGMAEQRAYLQAALRLLDEARAGGPQPQNAITGTIPGVTGYTIEELREIWEDMRADADDWEIGALRLACMAVGLANQNMRWREVAFGSGERAMEGTVNRVWADQVLARLHGMSIRDLRGNLRAAVRRLIELDS